MRDLPAAVRAKAEQAGAQEWLDGLPALIDDLTTRWRLRPAETFGDGTEAYVLGVTQADGTPAVLKLIVPRPGDAARHEITALRLADGVGCARLLRADEPRSALLLERLGPSMADLRLPFPDRLTILCDLARKVWRNGLFAGKGDGEPELSLPTGAQKAEWLSGFIRHTWLELDRPCSRAAVDQAVAAAESRREAHDPARAVLIHGDIHQWNALRIDGRDDRDDRNGCDGRDGSEGRNGSEGRDGSDGSDGSDGFKLVDPDGLWAEPECDLGVLMREDPVELMAADPWDRARWLAARTDTDPQAIWEWGLAERVSTGLVATAIGLQPVGAEMLAAADQIAQL